MIMRQDLVWWRSPFQILFYSLLECFYQLGQALSWLRQHRLYLLAAGAIAVIHFSVRSMSGTQQYIEQVEKKLIWYVYWVGLGILSSIGLGSGLHTFVLYLGPHIAAVTLAAHECGSLNFPEPPYPDEIVCPLDGSTDTISLFSIMAKVRVEAFMWGAGTALGELPPYFLARARSLSLSRAGEEAIDGDDESRMGRAIRTIIEKAGFFGILACASVPNPLFDLAGITCGHFLVPFWTFFGATLIGKAVIKMMIQKTFVILAFNEQYFLKLVQILRMIPAVGEQISLLVHSALVQQKASLHRNPMESKAPGWIPWAFQTFIAIVIISFVCSLINILAQNYVDRRQEEEKGLKKRTVETESTAQTLPPHCG